MKIIKKVGVACIKDNCLLLIKNKGISKYYLPVANCKDGENDFDTLLREMRDKFEADIDFKSIRLIGTHQDKSPGIPACEEKTSYYCGQTIGTIRHRNDLEELIWFDPRTSNFDDLSSIVKEKILPELFSKGMLN